MRFFNAAGPVRRIYCATAPLERMEVHELLNGGEFSDCRCLRTNVEVGQRAQGARAIPNGDWAA